LAVTCFQTFHQFKVSEQAQIAEVIFYFRAEIAGEAQAFALVDLFSEPDKEFLKESYGTVWSCGHGGSEHLQVITAKSILAVVAMVPHSLADGLRDGISQTLIFWLKSLDLTLCTYRAMNRTTTLWMTL
jgi:hypothetical protein